MKIESGKPSEQKHISKQAFTAAYYCSEITFSDILQNLPF